MSKPLIVSSIEHVEAGRISIQQIDPAEMSPGEFISRVRAAVEQARARVIVVDTLNGYLNAMPDERFLVLQMHELLSYLNQLGVVTILVLAQHGLMGPTLNGSINATRWPSSSLRRAVTA